MGVGKVSKFVPYTVYSMFTEPETLTLVVWTGSNW